MIKLLEISAKQIGDAIIDMGSLLSEKLQKWSDRDTLPSGLSAEEAAGFINKDDRDEGINFVIDLQAPEEAHKALLRAWAIDTTVDENNNEVSNNIQLTFSVDFEQAKTVIAKAGDISLDDLSNIINSDTTILERAIVSDNSGIDKTSDNKLGARYDLTVAEISDSEANDLIVVLDKVLATLNVAANAEASEVSL